MDLGLHMVGGCVKLIESSVEGPGLQSTIG